MNIHAILHFLDRCFTKYDDQLIHREFKGSGVEPNIKRVNGSGVRYVEVAPSGVAEHAIVFVHGAPGGVESFFTYLQDARLHRSMRLISVDRLGYGASQRGIAEPGIDAQAAALQPIIDKLRKGGQKITLVGHSFGGPIVARLAMQNRGALHSLLLLAPALDPQNEQHFWVTRLGKFIPTRWITPLKLRVAADEKWVHAKALEEIAQDWWKVDVPVVVTHGTKDVIVPFENLSYASKKLKHVPLKQIPIEGEDHFIPWTQHELVVKTLLGCMVGEIFEGDL